MNIRFITGGALAEFAKLQPFNLIAPGLNPCCIVDICGNDYLAAALIKCDNNETEE